MDRGAWWATVHGVTKSRTQLKSKTKVAAGLVFLQPLLGLQMAIFLCGAFLVGDGSIRTISALRLHIPGLSVCPHVLSL